MTDFIVQLMTYFICLCFYAGIGAWWALSVAELGGTSDIITRRSQAVDFVIGALWPVTMPGILIGLVILLLWRLALLMVRPLRAIIRSLRNVTWRNA